ncbi:YwqG family protein [Cytophagaceae bacterium YF14B1]|uniref:YwqG family protein n=1 Tax=Xanthocytophaga flava TaxID=3048013 RepID=A0AAE3QSH4_9BACT|nr:YwqG family protein [Xanthocytophaga flavus]MDJ1482411.1 YwqG family protein [Xanthocytophaga flavus]
MEKQSFENFVCQNFKEKYQQVALQMIKPTIRLHTEVKSEAEIPIGYTKIGGYPDLPLEFEWPASKYTNEPLWFVAQIKLEEVKDWDKEKMLPITGILYFFAIYDHGHVMYFDGDTTTLIRRSAPIELQVGKRNWLQRIFTREERKIFPACSVSIRTEYTLPYWPALYKALSGDYSKEEDVVLDIDKYFYDQELLLNEKEHISRHLLLGYATPIQSEYIESGPVTEVVDWDKLRNEDIAKINQWCLLFQLDSDDNTKMNWVDGGRIYFLIEKDKLAKRDFTNVYVTMECY